MERNHDKLKDVVADLMARDARCRRDTKWLTIKVIGHYTKIFIPYMDLSKIPSFESIARCKRDTAKLHGYREDFEEEGVTYESPQPN